MRKHSIEYRKTDTGNEINTFKTNNCNKMNYNTQQPSFLEQSSRQKPVVRFADRIFNGSKHHLGERVLQTAGSLFPAQCLSGGNDNESLPRADLGLGGL